MKIIRLKSFFQFFGLFMVLALAGCATIREEGELQKPPAVVKKGIYHKVVKGQTIWRIAKTYGVSIDDIIVTNSIPNVAKLEEGQLIFIPGADKVQEIPEEVSDNQNDFIWPVKGKVVRYFREPKGGAVNNGIDILAQDADSVKASRAGKVVLADYLSGYGHTVILDHADGLYSVYGQNAKLSVGLGDSVAQGMPIGVLASDKNASFLHFEIRKNAHADNPLFYLP